MGIYSEDYNVDISADEMDELCEAFLIDDLTHNYTDAALEEFMAPGGVGEALINEGVFTGKIRKVIDGKTLKANDMNRRTAIAAFMAAKAAGDPMWKKLVKIQAIRKALKAKIMKKYAAKAKKTGKASQKEFIKRMRTVRKSFNQAGGADR